MHTEWLKERVLERGIDWRKSYGDTRERERQTDRQRQTDRKKEMGDINFLLKQLNQCLQKHVHVILLLGWITFFTRIKHFKYSAINPCLSWDHWCDENAKSPNRNSNSVLWFYSLHFSPLSYPSLQYKSDISHWMIHISRGRWISV